jgi:UDP-N-acetylglucosamine 4,6-dehydratase
MNENLSLHDKVILVTGGTGSFGKQFIRKALTEHRPRKVIVFSRDELKQWEMRQSDPVFDHADIRYFLGDVRDKDRLERAFREVDYVVHAAALKQVPAAEYNPTEFIKTNVHGAMNVIDAAIDRGVEKVIALSTDKAANPINLYGATKLCSDKLFVAANAYVGAKGMPKFSVVRYGNVLGSRGSIVPKWRKMVVLGGEVFVPKIPSMKITDLVTAIAPNVSMKVTGIRPGEKLHELMIGEDDSRNTVEFEDHYAIAPQAVFNQMMASYERLQQIGGKPLREAFVYASDTNERWLDVAGLQAILKTLTIEH